jgi:[glutamine synthetase] adenylyltransferase / [glutamine synthetase]-adenylyl-L-tyrosine phosphorylase
MAAFHEQLIEHVRTTQPASPTQISPEEAARLDRLAHLSPLYRSVLLNQPEILPWVLRPPHTTESREGMIANEWRAIRQKLDPEAAEYLPALRAFRRRMSLRIAYRDVNRLQPCSRSVLELSLLAELCIRECYQVALARWSSRLGQPWDEALKQPARFCVIALGKLGGHELNFSSDIDLIYVFEGEGHCRKDGEPTTFTNLQFFTKLAETLTNLLQEQTEHGFLFRVDLRLRPEGSRSPLVRSLAGMENYYAAAGQSWERMAFIKARPVAGDIALGAELLEALHSFRYPRHPPPSLLAEIASMKLRTEKEVVGSANLHRDVKRGLGGIREIEFIVQTMQLLHAGRFPFLQTHSTVEGLDQLARYRLMSPGEAKSLQEAYWFLREVEHRLQVREEQQTHTLPSDPAQLEAIAESFGFPEAAALEQRLEEVRSGVRSAYAELLQGAAVDEELMDWWLYFSEKKTPPAVAAALLRWFGRDEDPYGPLRDFVQGSRNYVLNREQVSRFTGLVKELDRVMPMLAFPLRALQRISRFADSYGTRSQFLGTCSLDRRFFEILALLFDRSEFILELLCQHPEILDEVLRPEILRRRKSAEDTLRELQKSSPGENFEDWLWLYVKAEQIRIAIGELLAYLDQEEAEKNLSTLADAVLTFLLRREDPEGHLLVVALGKYGGSELTFGSDLDLLVVGDGRSGHRDARAIRSLLKCLAHRSAQGSIFQIDLRLRPHGRDGPLVATLPALRTYHKKQAQSWEKQILTRARIIAGPPALTSEFNSFLQEILYAEPTSDEELQELWDMRLRIERERDRVNPPQRAFKTGAGGLVDLEFFAQFLQLRHGHEFPELREPSTRKLLQTIGDLNLMDAAQNEMLRENLHFLRCVEVLLRRDRYSAVSIIPASPEEQYALARWSRFRTWEEFWGEYCRTLTTTRRIVSSFISEHFNIDVGIAPVGGS